MNIKFFNANNVNSIKKLEIVFSDANECLELNKETLLSLKDIEEFIVGFDERNCENPTQFCETLGQIFVSWKKLKCLHLSLVSMISDFNQLLSFLGLLLKLPNLQELSLYLEFES